VTWPYREVVLDLQPHGPLPSQIYWRRRVLALGIAALVIGVVVAVVVVMLTGSSGAETKNANQPAPAITPTPLAGENPEVKTPVIPPAEHSPAVRQMRTLTTIRIGFDRVVPADHGSEVGHSHVEYTSLAWH
jgi:negative regulator of sigma E activity